MGKSNKKIKIITAAIILAVIAGIFLVFFNKNNVKNNEFSGYIAEVYYSPSCGCCVNYMGYLRNNGFQVKPIKIEDNNKIKDELNIPKNMRSCHTTKIGNYFVEGHMPVEAIKKMLEEKPDIDGIALPGMPSGSPGMPGPKSTFDVKAIKDGQPQGTFVKI